MHYSRPQPQSLLLSPPTPPPSGSPASPPTAPPCRHIDAFGPAPSHTVDRYDDDDIDTGDDDGDGDGDGHTLLHRFVVGSHAARENVLHLVEYYDGALSGPGDGSGEGGDGADGPGLRSPASLRVPGGGGPVLSLQCAGSASMWMVVGGDVPGAAATAGLYRLPDELWDGADVVEVVALPLDRAGERGDPASAAARDGENSGTVATLHPSTGRAVLWDVSGEEGREVGGAQLSPEGPPGGVGAPSAAAPRWDPHHENMTGFCVARGVGIVDWRCPSGEGGGRVSQSVPSCHRYGCSDMDYNPNRPHVISTGGMDGLVKFWDLRKTDRGPIRILKGHTHWISTVRYNRFHDQLLLSGGTDSLLNLWRVSSISSAPLLELDDDAVGVGPGSYDDLYAPPSPYPSSPRTTTAAYLDAADVRVAGAEHQEAVLGAAWSASDAWLYASVSYDGQVMVSHVPSREKYKILL